MDNTNNNLNSNSMNNSESLIKGCCPYCKSEDFFRIRAKNHDYSFVLGIMNPKAGDNRILPFLPVEVLACAKCRKLTLETQAFDSDEDEQ